ncbi:hypothetical protein FocTR4_00005144 [Fusarium oxysporum f. sp. cubense]|uniref:Uncharacterized protein n=1 Tax=Fusarium oxysporum f. sp. cubense TaxID=61366 RepID=A0A5C6TJW8_FUSOC|nr:hypothetical protein FocTR4_00005144 [Fusarium oxysporum f. sp. cubense]
MSRPCPMNAPEGNFVQKPASEPPRSEEAGAPSMRPGIDLERQAGGWAKGTSASTISLHDCKLIYSLKVHLILQASQVSALDKPGNYFLRHLLPCFKEMLNSRDGDGVYLDEPMNDWVSLNQPNRMDQLICLAPHTKVGRALFRPFVTGKEEIGNNVQYHYNEGIIRSIAFTLFTSIIAVFACAPAAIQSLNVRSTVGEVVVYLVFVIAFGWLSQGLILGFEKVLLSCLAYAGLMATLLRGG